MAIGPGKYDHIAEGVMRTTNADGVVVLVFGEGKQGGSIMVTRSIAQLLPQLLREIANGLEADHARMKGASES